MKSVWIALSTLAIANLLAIFGLVGWLQATGRLNADRMERVRAVFARTVAEDSAQAHPDAALAAPTKSDAADAAHAAPPQTAEQRLAQQQQRDDTASQQSQRIQREASDLIKTLMQERAELERDRAEFQKQVEDFKSMRERIAKEEGSEQFEKAVQLYQSLKPEQAKNMMRSLLAGGGMEQVVAYLNALPPRNSARILAEFESEDPKVAADLLERLRTRGTELGSAAAPPEG